MRVEWLILPDDNRRTIQRWKTFWIHATHSPGATLVQKTIETTNSLFSVLCAKFLRATTGSERNLKSISETKEYLPVKPHLQCIFFQATIWLWSTGFVQLFRGCVPCCTDCLMVCETLCKWLQGIWVSGTHLGPVAECSCIFCIDAVAVADRHLTEVAWRQGLQALYSTATGLSAWTQGSEEHCVKCSGPGVDTVCFGKKKRDIPLLIFYQEGWWYRVPSDKRGQG